MDLLKMILKMHRKPRPNDGKRILVARKEPLPKQPTAKAQQPEKHPLPDYYKIVIEAHKSTTYLFNYN